MSDPASDAGPLDMFFNIVNKYILVPQASYPDSFSAKESGIIALGNANMDWLINVKFGEQALALREIVQST